MKVRSINTVVSNDKIDSKYDYKRYVVSGKNKQGKYFTQEIFENQDKFITLKSREVFSSLEEAFEFLTK